MDFTIVLFTNKLPYELEEWFAYHKLHGCSQFIVYDNREAVIARVGSADWTEEFICKYDIDYDSIMGERKQITAYNSVISIQDDSNEWTFILDDDEYLVPLINSGMTVSEYLDQHKLTPSLGYKVSWKFFGTSGHEERVDGLTIENYLWCQRGLNPHYKSMFQPAHAKQMLDPHTVEMKNGEPLQHLVSLYIAHYHTKSKEEYRDKCDRPRADNGERRNFEESLAAHDLNDVFNTDVAFWGKRVREIINKI